MPNYIMQFGKYSGEDVSKIPRKYLNQMLENLYEGPELWRKDIDLEELENALEIERFYRNKNHVTF